MGLVLPLHGGRRSTRGRGRGRPADDDLDVYCIATGTAIRVSLGLQHRAHNIGHRVQSTAPCISFIRSNALAILCVQVVALRSPPPSPQAGAVTTVWIRLPRKSTQCSQTNWSTPWREAPTTRLTSQMKMPGGRMSRALLILTEFWPSPHATGRARG